MANFNGSSTLAPEGPLQHTTWDAAQHARVRKTNLPEEFPAGTEPQVGGIDLVEVTRTPALPANVNLGGCLEERMTFASDWFGKFHVAPPSFLLGNILATLQIPVSIWSAYRRDTHSWDAFVNNAGNGVNLLNAPALPLSIPPQTATPSNMVLEVSPNGPPSVDTTLDWVFDSMTIQTPIVLERVILFSVRPELPYTETLEWLTEVMTHKDGSEQRLMLRKNPRQIFEWAFTLAPGAERTRIHNLLFNWQARIFGVPIWHETTFLTAPLAGTETVIPVRTTSYADYREGGLVLIFSGNTAFDVGEIAVGGIGATSITLTNPVLQAHAIAGTMVMPLRTGTTQPTIQGTRFISDTGQLRVRFQVLDNDVDLADASPFATYNGKILLDGCNSLGSQPSLPERIIRDIVVLDNGVGVPYQDTPWTRGKRIHRKQFHCRTNQQVWETRQLLHSLRGRQKSWYLPSFGKDFVPNANLISGSATLTIENVGYDAHVNQVKPLNHIRIKFKDPAEPTLYREIIGSSEVNSTTEQLTLDDTWPQLYTPEEVDRISYVELSRFDSDSLRFRYELGDKTVRVGGPVITVFD